jgi:hypothetical protein
MLADAHAPKSAPHAIELFHPWLKRDPKRDNAFTRDHLKNMVAERWRELGKEPPQELT